MESLQDKVAIITGGSYGIGAGIARVFASQGAKIVIAARDEARGEKIGAELREMGTPAIFVQTDVSQKAAAQNLAAQTLRHFGRIDILICNAGLFWE